MLLMKKQFWLNSWEEGGFKTSFHRKDIHPYLLKHLPPSKLQGKRVLVPLCGKSVDLVYFAQHAEEVIGVELSQKAVDQFFEEQELEYQQAGSFYKSGNLTLIQGDFFNLEPAEIGEIDLVYDRAALVALPLSMRLQYIQKVKELLPHHAQLFINTLEYFPLQQQPPFSISATDLASYYGEQFDIQHLESPLVPNHGLIRCWGLDFVKEHGFWLTPRG